MGLHRGVDAVAPPVLSTVLCSKSLPPLMTRETWFAGRMCVNSADDCRFN